MRNRAFIFAVTGLVLAIGCGGGGGEGGGGGPTTTTGGVPGAGPGDSIAMVNLPSSNPASGRMNIAYLPRQGRDVASISAELREMELRLGFETFVEPLVSPLFFELNGSEVQNRSAAVPVGVGSNSRLFDTYVQSIWSVIYDEDGTVTVFDARDPLNPDDPPTNPLVREDFPAAVRILEARETTLEVRLNDAMFDFDFDVNPPTATFRRDIFELANLSGDGRMQGFISDFVMFDISEMGAGRPMMGNGVAAQRAYFSGDRFALSSTGPSGYFEMLTKDVLVPMPGEFEDSIIIGTSSTPGVYRTVTIDPNDPSPTPGTITALYGIFRPFTDSQFASRSVVRDVGDFEVILMPTSSDDDNQQILLIARDSGDIVNLYWGNADLSSGTFSAYPIANLPSGSTTGQIDGTLSGYLDAFAVPVGVASPADGGLVRYGRYAITSTHPAEFEDSGRFIVFRR